MALEKVLVIACLLVACFREGAAGGSSLIDSPPDVTYHIENSEVELSCVIDIDPALTFTVPEWRHYTQGSGSYEKLANSAPYTLTANRQDSGSFTVTNLSMSATFDVEGNYTCGLNQFGRASLVVESSGTVVLVAVSPEIVSNSSIIVHEGSTAVLNCTATGVPPPLVEWRDRAGTVLKSGNATSLVTTLTDVRRSSAGDYACHASNFVNQTEVTRELVVYYKPMIREISESQLVAVESGLRLTCTASGLPAPHVTWLHHMRNLTLLPHVLLSHAVDDARDGHSNLSAEATMAGDQGQYTCVATNEVGHTRRHLQVTLQFRPDAPVMNPTDGMRPEKDSMTFSWERPNYHNSTIIAYEVEMRSSDNASWEAVPVDPASVQSLATTVLDLTPWTEYQFRVRAQNGIGYSDFSNATDYIRTLPLVPVRPENTTVVSTASTAIDLHWQLPATWMAEHGDLTYVTVQYRLLRTLSFQRYQENVPAGARQGTVSIPNLMKGSPYYFRVSLGNAFFNGGFEEVFENTTTTLEPTTTPPTSRAATDETDSESADDANDKQLITILAAACGGGAVLVMLIVVLVIYRKQHTTTNSEWHVAGGAAPVPKANGAQKWSAANQRNPESPIREQTDGSYRNLAMQRVASNLSWPSQRLETDTLEGMAQMEDDLDAHTNPEPSTFTSFSVGRQYSVQRSMSAATPTPTPTPPPPSLPQQSPPRTPPDSPPATPAMMLKPQYTSSPIVEKSQISDGHDLSHINQTNTFAPLATKKDTDV